MRSLIFVTQEVDPAHPALAATVPKIAALSRRLDRIAVLSGGEVPGVLPGNCVVHTFGASTKAERGLRFTGALAAELGRPRPLAVIAHMCPIYAGLDVRLLAHGPTLSELEQGHRAELERLVHELRLDDRVRLEGPVPRSEIAGLFAASDALVNNMRAGAPDKVVYEASAACLPVIASNPVFDELLPDERRALGRTLHERVVRSHSVEHWADQVVAAAEAA